MTTILQADDALVSYWRDNWTSTPFALEGEDYKPTRGVAHAYLRIRERDPGQETQGPSGARRFRRLCNALVTIKTPATGGTAAGAALAQTARTLLEAKRVGALEFLGGTRADRIGVDGEWLVHLVTAPFAFQEIK